MLIIEYLSVIVLLNDNGFYGANPKALTTVDAAIFVKRSFSILNAKRFGWANPHAMRATDANILQNG
jgi:hypothetical protein